MRWGRWTFLAVWAGAFLPLFLVNGIFHAGPGARFFDAAFGGIASARKMADGSPIYPALIDANLVLAMLVFTRRGAARDPSERNGAIVGAWLGLVASATWNLANHAVILGWPPIVTVVDVAWHVLVGAADGAWLGYLLARAQRRVA